MKKTATILLMIALNSVMSQAFIKSNGCLKMYSNSYITTSGAFYSAWIKNTCDKYMYIGKSEYIIKFETSNSKGETRIFAKRKGIDFPQTFLAPGTSIYGNKNRSDGSSSSYDDIRSETGDMGNVYEAHLGTITDFDPSMELKVDVPILLGQNNGVNFYATLKTYDKFFDKNWEDFEKYKVDITFENTKNIKDPGSYDVHFEMVFCGIIYQGDVSVRKLNPLEKLTKSENYKFFCNFTPRVFIRNKGTSSVQKLNEYNDNKVAQLKTENLSLFELLDHEKKAKEEGSEIQAKAIHDFAFQKHENTPYVAYSKANDAEEIHDAINLYKKCISLSKEKDFYYYDSYYKIAVCNNHIANKLWEEKKYTEADKTYKEALVNINSAEPLTNMNANLSKEKYTETKKNYEELSTRYIKEQEKIKLEKTANQKLYNSLVSEGDAAVKKSDYVTAVEKYNSAINLDINSKVLQPKLAAAKGKVETQQKKEKENSEKKMLFETAISEGDEKIKLEDLSGANASYQKALSTNYNNKLANEKIQFSKELDLKNGEYLKRFSNITDHQNMKYTTVKLGGQQWYVQNCRTTEKSVKYVWLEALEKPKQFKKAKKASYWLPLRSNIDSSLGKLYNMHAIKENLLCKEGWHISTVEDWKKLFQFVNAETMESKIAHQSLYKISKKNVLNYEKNTTIAIIDSITGFGIHNTGYVYEGEYSFYVPIYTSKLPSYWAIDESKKLYEVRFEDKKEYLQISIWQFYDEYFQDKAYPCKCVKD
jgi:uncharacterized protein (TIGR02145 family)